MKQEFENFTGYSDVFRTIVLLSLANGYMSDKAPLSDKVSDNVSDKYLMSDKVHRQRILSYMAENKEINAATTAKLIDRSPGTARRVLAQLVQEGVLTISGANRNRVYRLTKV